ncbi:hypothetical protein BH10PLA2_BH10PLA2_34060 [soil metagenome]
MSVRLVKRLTGKGLDGDPVIRALAAASAGIGISLLSAGVLPESGDVEDFWALANVALRVILPIVSVVVAGWAVARAPQSVAVVGLAALLTALAARAVEPSLDSVRLALIVASIVAAGAGLLLLLPQNGRRLVVSLLILFHFCGIFCAILAAPPPGTAPPWLTTQIWTKLFRPYLQFAYLNNAYHFYSPEPGPATLLWFRIEAVDGTARWKKIPSRADAKDPLLVEYFRRLSLTENAAQLATIQNIPPDIARRRALASLNDVIPSVEEIAAEKPGIIQYRPLAPNSRNFLASFARHIALASVRNGEVEKIRNIKVYRVVHSVIHPGLLASGMSPVDHKLYAPFYEGMFNAEGTLLDPDDAYLYWLIPVLGPKPGVFASSRSGRENPSLSVSSTDRDFLTIHAGSSPWEEDQ